MIRKLLLVSGLLVVTGCSAFLATSQDLYYHDEVFAPRRKAEEVAILAERPRTPFIVLGRIVATQGMFGSRESVLAEMRRKAAALGADALVDLSEGQGARSQSEGAESRSEMTHFEQEGQVSTSETWIPESRSSIRLTISGLAIRFQPVGSPQGE